MRDQMGPQATDLTGSEVPTPQVKGQSLQEQMPRDTRRQTRLRNTKSTRSCVNFRIECNQTSFECVDWSMRTPFNTTLRRVVSDEKDR